ncbi:MAG: alpha/beta fold hydrolase [Flavobacteriales bacterium]|nr:alpha/beta fold hydrolase [Flavobacteriia bacterium]NCP05287.1 alpha/beta fold hydrolase [Flavobacteriales bacterium]PIV95072.1 MAG: alpha/beta hydrolase [Flavobacteriaceae bacterium CG17_big_fil_post_rev_8_21_14_2_50_33_15]PIY09296.1 MAG: alpha/beta hydrolase [Flavobacteriaceae bacterium CG_4_10_14_3_um_filter_33_47]PJB20270.1 MAG: alpha/beta hydrolase [Flavobacteriaceae bacterium CG_4_9_14_3_um_filter_33_16]
MPIVESTYKPPYFFRNGHVSTVYSGLVRQVKGLIQERERITLPDEDFLDLDWSFSEEKTKKLIILLHGLEGNAQRPYMTGTAKLFNQNAMDAVSVNFRGCSGMDNLKYRSYHSGATEDLEAIINHIMLTKNYTHIYIKGISLGGNMALKYLGEREDIPEQIKAVIAVSVPCFLEGSAKKLHALENRLYHNRFKKHLVDRLQIKQQKFSDILSLKELNSINNLYDFDDVYTAKAHGFKDGADYYAQCSSLQFLPNIKIPTLIINALNDSFLSPECYPVKAAKQNPYLFLEMPKHGGHVGFIDKKNVYFNERKALDFALRNS